MKFVLLSDMHGTTRKPVARTDEDYSATFINKFRQVLRLAKRENAVILQAGDFCDAPREWDFLDLMVNLLRPLQYDVEICTVYGQHDIYNRNRNSKCVLSTLDAMGLVTILSDKPTTFGPHQIATVRVYGSSWGEPEPVVEKHDNIINILVTHDYITASPRDFPHLTVVSARHFMNVHKEFDYVLCGDLHKFFIESSADGRKIVNTGPLMRNTAEPYVMNHAPSVCLLDTNTETIARVELDYKPSEEVLTREHIEREKEVKELLNEFTASMSKIDIEHINMRDALNEFLDHSKNITKEVRTIVERLASGLRPTDS